MPLTIILEAYSGDRYSSLLRVGAAQQPHNSPRRRSPQKLRQAVGSGEEGDGPLPLLYGLLPQSQHG